ILGLVSLPAYDDNLFARGIQKEEYDQLLKDPYKPLFNRVISALYEPGSTIKPLVAAGALQDGVITAKTTISDPGVISIQNQYNPAITYNFPDWKPGGHGMVNVYKAIEQSCDIFFYAVGGGWQNIKGLGVDRLNKWYAKFGMGQKTGIDIPGEQDGFIPTPEWKEKTKKESWYQGDTYHISIGQGDLTVTPLQLLNYTAAMANGGTFYKPHLVSKIQTADGQMVKTIAPEVIAKDVVSGENLAVSREGMRLVASAGTGRLLSDLPVPSAGKTGTAQNPHGEPHSWFISFAPYDNPQIAIVVMVENAGEGHEYALPVTKEILNYYFTRPQK
ncbi:MAG: penicillin-binding protein 2, partial [Thermoplasmata archaeon]|nr:penicillin-binding protein 2 [Thermoplasmata archaeon]